MCKIGKCKRANYSKNLCQRHYTIEYRFENIVKYTYNNLKSNAKRRGKLFQISFEQFKNFVVEVDYIAKKGIYKKSLHIDRIDENLGYSIENIQVLTNSDNVKKFLNYKYNGEKMEFKTVTYKSPEFTDIPF